MKREDLVWLLDLANAMRKYKGDETLDDLPNAYRREPEECLIAKAFNYGCHVGPSGDNENGYIQFQSVSDRETYEKIIFERGLTDGFEEWKESYIDDMGETYFNFYRLESFLPAELNNVAIAFDGGEYKEYERKRAAYLPETYDTPKT